MKVFETKKLFWDEYLYKLVVHNRLAVIFRNQNLSHAEQVLLPIREQYAKGLPLALSHYRRLDFLKESQYLDAEKLFHLLSLADNYRLRVESSTLNLYSNDSAWLESISTALTADNVTAFWKPKASCIEHLLEKTIILQEKINYQFRVTLGNKRGNAEFAAFAGKNPHLIRIGSVLKKGMATAGWVNGMYFYARDERVIQLCYLMLDNIRRIDKVIYKQDIDKYLHGQQ